ncbi:MAG: transcriptional repressor [Phycisphaerae bacterium]|nr:transcriptional repressor [Phycisphaerae bacterium]
MARNGRRQRIEQFEQLCRERKLPVTLQRRAVLEEILGRRDHPTADQIYDVLKVRLRGLSRTTVYRTIETLVELGFITKVCHLGSAARFDPKVARHHHLVCMRCECILDLEADPTEAIAWPDVQKQGFEICDYHIHFRGLCAACRRTRGGPKRSTRTTRNRRAGTPARVKSIRPSKGRRTQS